MNELIYNYSAILYNCAARFLSKNLWDWTIHKVHNLTTSYICLFFLAKDNYINGSILKAFQLNATMKGQNWFGRPPHFPGVLTRDYHRLQQQMLHTSSSSPPSLVSDKGQSFTWWWSLVFVRFVKRRCWWDLVREKCSNLPSHMYRLVLSCSHFHSKLMTTSSQSLERERHV